MIEKFDSKVENIKVTLGPSIQKCCYEVSNELAKITANNFGNNIIENRNINLQKINQNQLLKIGIKKENITISTICTKCSNEPYFSYRKDKDCGRFAGLLMLR